MSEIFITTISTKQIENRHNVKYPTYVKKKLFHLFSDSSWKYLRKVLIQNKKWIR